MNVGVHQTRDDGFFPSVDDSINSILLFQDLMSFTQVDDPVTLNDHGAIFKNSTISVYGDHNAVFYQGSFGHIINPVFFNKIIQLLVLLFLTPHSNFHLTRLFK
jgi:hypothetical protein